MRPVRAMSLAPQAAGQTPGTDLSGSTRREQRSAAQLTFAVCGLAASGKFFVELCSTVNISRSGCCLRLRTRPQRDSALALRAVPGGTSLPEGISQLLFQLAWLRPDGNEWVIGAFSLGDADLPRLAFPYDTL